MRASFLIQAAAMSLTLGGCFFQQNNVKIDKDEDSGCWDSGFWLCGDTGNSFEAEEPAVSGAADEDGPLNVYAPNGLSVCIDLAEQVHVPDLGECEQR